MTNNVLNEWMYSTILIKNQRGRLGTGFAVMRTFDNDTRRGKSFLVTNKHVLGTQREQMKTITLGLNVNIGEKIEKHEIQMALHSSDGKKGWKEHPDKDTDVLVVDISAVMNKLPLAIKLADYSLFANTEILKQNEISIGDEVMVLGYPLGLKHKTTNFPLVRKAMISTTIGEEIEISTRENGRIRDRVIRGFIIDGGTSPGSSGSPVIYYAPLGRFTSSGIRIGGSRPYLLGIVSESRLAIVESDAGDYPTFSGLAIAFDAETIKETIELFFPN